MTPAILQHVKFHASPKILFEMYMDSGKHAAATGAPAKMSRKIGGEWHAHGGAIGGKNLLIVPGQKIVQAWRLVSESRSRGRAAARPKGRAKRLAELLLEAVEKIFGCKTMILARQSLTICAVPKLSGENAHMAFGAFTVHVDEIPRFVERFAAVRANKSQAEAHLLVVLKNSADSVYLHTSDDQEAGN
jgi:hypothetical protein